MKYFKIYVQETPDQYNIWAVDGVMERQVYNSNGIPNDDFKVWHNPSEEGVITIKGIMDEIANGSSETVLEELTEEEAFVEMV